MVLETSQESYASAMKDVEPLVNQIKPEDLKAYNSDKMNLVREFPGLLPDVTVDFDKHGMVTPNDKCFPIRIGRRPEDGISDPIDEIRDLLFGSSYYNLQSKVGRAAEREAVSKLSPEEQKKYQEEKEALEAYERHRAMDMYLHHDDPPPPTPTMDKVNRRASEIEQQARDHVIAHLTPEERRQYEEEQRKYNESPGWDDNPIHAMVYRPVPTPGPMMKEVERRAAGAIRSHAYEDQPVVVCKTPAFNLPKWNPRLYEPKWSDDVLLSTAERL